MNPYEYTETLTLLRQHRCHGHVLLLDVFQATFPDPHRTPGLHKHGDLMVIVITYLVDVELMPSPDMRGVHLFAKCSWLVLHFAAALRPMLRRWKKQTKHDRGLVQQVSQLHFLH